MCDEGKERCTTSVDVGFSPQGVNDNTTGLTPSIGCSGINVLDHLGHASIWSSSQTWVACSIQSHENVTFAQWGRVAECSGSPHRPRRKRSLGPAGMMKSLPLPVTPSSGNAKVNSIGGVPDQSCGSPSVHSTNANSRFSRSAMCRSGKRNGGRRPRFVTTCFMRVATASGAGRCLRKTSLHV